jgi:hypothetical protein
MNAPLPFPTSICHGCTAHRYVRGKTSVFIRCTALPVKYPPQPVKQCPAFEPDQASGDPSLKPSSRR